MEATEIRTRNLVRSRHVLYHLAITNLHFQTYKLMYYLVYSCVYLSCCVHQLVDVTTEVHTYVRRDQIQVLDS